MDQKRLAKLHKAAQEQRALRPGMVDITDQFNQALIQVYGEGLPEGQRVIVPEDFLQQLSFTYGEPDR